MEPTSRTTGLNRLLHHSSPSPDALPDPFAGGDYIAERAQKLEELVRQWISERVPGEPCVQPLPASHQTYACSGS